MSKYYKFQHFGVDLVLGLHGPQKGGGAHPVVARVEGGHALHGEGASPFIIHAQVLQRAGQLLGTGLRREI